MGQSDILMEEQTMSSEDESGRNFGQLCELSIY